MIAALRGPLVRWDAGASVAWIEAGGVTYEVLIPAYARDWIDAVPPGDEVHVFTYEHATERQPVATLFGFPSLHEREFFRKFIDVPDVGPTKAVRALTHPVPEIARWIEQEDARSLRLLPGIGQRLASTIVAHLRGKVVQEALLRPAVPPADGAVAANGHALREDAVEALVALQYSEREAEALVTEALVEQPGLDTLEDVLRAVLSRQGAAT